MKKLTVTTLLLTLLLTLTAPAYAANASSFSDVEKIKNWEAVAALSKLGVIDGKADGSFDPAGKVTRAEAAKLLFMLAHGGKDEQSGEKKDVGFSDTAGHWAEEYIAWCAQESIIVGRGDGIFAPDGEVTGVELAKMAEVLLGYDPAAYALTGSRWAENVDELGSYLGLYDGTFFEDTDDPLVPASREETSQILYNALKVPPRVLVPSVHPKTGETLWQYGEQTDENGESVSLLFVRFGMTEVSVPAQPGKKK